MTLSLLCRVADAQTGLLVVAHGSGPEWNAGVRQAAQGAGWTAGPLEVAFLMGAEAMTSGWDSAVTRLARAGVRDAVVVPLMVSTHGAHYRQVEHYAGLRAELPPELADHDHRMSRGAPPFAVRMTRALDDSPEVGQALGAAWAALPPADRRRPVMLIAHGPERDEEAARWIEALGAAGRALERAGLTAGWRVALLRDDAPAPVRASFVAQMRDTITAQAARAADSVVAMPVMISAGTLTRTRIPADIAGLPVRYVVAPLASDPALSHWIARVAGAALAAAPACAAAEAGGRCD
jgi:sirohydrochlorin ferrochelatase